MVDCVEAHDVCVIRGDSFAQSLGLGTGFEEVGDTPAAHQGLMVIRAAHDDSLTPLLTVTVTPEAASDPHGEALAYLHFSITPDQTAALPPYDCVYHVELTDAGSPPASRTRLIAGAVKITD